MSTQTFLTATAKPKTWQGPLWVPTERVTHPCAGEAEAEEETHGNHSRFGYHCPVPVYVHVNTRCASIICKTRACVTGTSKKMCKR